MSLINKFKQADNNNLALAVGAAALATSAGLALVVYNQQKRITELTNMTALTANVTLGLANATGRMMATQEENQ